jgi:hypothetical protein
MIGSTMVRARILALCLLTLAAAACALEKRPHEVLAAGAEPLRTQFNGDVGRPRIVILAAPT